MTERFHPTIGATEQFMQSIGNPLPPDSVDEVYSVFNPNRFVFRVDSSVYKIRHATSEALVEFERLQLLIPFYQQLAPQFEEASMQTSANGSWSIIRMPWMGYSIQTLTSALDAYIFEKRDNPLLFYGFTAFDINLLIRSFIEDQHRFTSETGLIHGDILQSDAPNNIVYNPWSNRFFAIDAEAFSPINSSNQSRFNEHAAYIAEWMLASLLIHSRNTEL